MRFRSPVTLLLALGLLLGAALTPAAAQTLEDGEAALDRLKDKLKDRKSINEELIAGLDEVMEYYRGLKAPEKPEPQAVPDGASEEERKAIEDANKKAERDWESEDKKFERGFEKFQKHVRDILLDAFTLVRADPQTKTNKREDVNIKAAELLGTLNEDPDVADDVSKDIIKAMDRTLFKAKNYDVTELLFEKAFAALASLNQMKSLEWMIDEFSHTKSSPPKEVQKLSAAHKAMVLFHDVPGDIRYALVDEFITQYTGVESSAETSSTDPAVLAKKQFWDRIKGDVIKVMQYYTGEPQDADGQVLARMDAFRDWFRENDNKRKAPWVDAPKD